MEGGEVPRGVGLAVTPALGALVGSLVPVTGMCVGSRDGPGKGLAVGDGDGKSEEEVMSEQWMEALLEPDWEKCWLALTTTRGIAATKLPLKNRGGRWGCRTAVGCGLMLGCGDGDDEGRLVGGRVGCPVGGGVGMPVGRELWRGDGTRSSGEPKRIR